LIHLPCARACPRTRTPACAYARAHSKPTTARECATDQNREQRHGQNRSRTEAEQNMSLERYVEKHKYTTHIYIKQTDVEGSTQTEKKRISNNITI
jgi:hypothetical protein